MTASTVILGASAAGAFLLLWSLIRAWRMHAIAEPLHELRGALTALDLGISVAFRRAACEPEVRSVLEALRAPVARAESAVADLEGGPGEGRSGPARASQRAFDLRALLHGAASAWSELAPGYGASFELDWHAGDAWVAGEPAVLARALDNLLANALEHGGGRVLVEARRRRGTVTVTVSDGGRGPGAALGPPWRARLPQRRSGRGLAITRSAVDALDGRLRRAEGRNGSGVAVELPLVRRPPVGLPDAGAHSTPLAHRRNGSVPAASTTDTRAA